MSSINTNVASMTGQRWLANTGVSLQSAMARLSSGLRVNSAKDDAAGMAIAAGLEAQARGMNVAIRNANDAISMAATADGALGTIANNLQRMRELAVQGANAGANTTALTAEWGLLQAENTRIIGGTSFNGVNLMAAVSSTFQVGANTADTITVTTTAASQTSAAGTLSIATADADITAINAVRATWGATQNRFESVVANLRVGAENFSAARGRIMDADYAMETANLSRAQVLQQAGTAMVAQANQGPQGVLALLR
ncbi:MAG: flagellin FliC [Gammaproteobacteria bacterium]|jgi:flagellin|nr:flagellin FliC [Gammaproteobacteria bacterium]MBU0785899.1 flagellin FliC [Gammaproteobacteria bacterium]MBU0816512.1 flagellin FliC [Gammaproteobacteria bacterium]MBU1788313.1 flagellin FliC [Gammaproteobacteria bacterium]